MTLNPSVLRNRYGLCNYFFYCRGASLGYEKSSDVSERKVLKMSAVIFNRIYFHFVLVEVCHIFNVWVQK